MTTALILTTFNRPEYLKRCLESLQQLEELPLYYVIVDDCSTDKETLSILQETNTTGSPYFIRGIKGLLNKQENRGIKHSLQMGFAFAFSLKVDLAINLDSDAIVKPDFITRLKDLKARFPGHIVSGFNCNHPKNPILFDGDDYVMRQHANGINMCMNREQYEAHVLPALQSQGNWDYSSTHNKPFVISKPSVVSHLGWDNSTMGHVNGDRACDF